MKAGAAARRGLRWLRDGWLMVGIGLLSLTCAELGWRAIGALPAGGPSGDEVPEPFMPAPLQELHPHAEASWWRPYLQELRSLEYRWEPFAYYRLRPFSGRYVRVDENGLRVTPRASVQGGAPLRVFLFGGSAMWGFFQRDAHTLAARLARELAERGYDAQITNFAQIGYVGAQGLVTLVGELRRGNVPDVVVFWDGINDLNAARRNGRAGVSYLEHERVADYDAMTRMRREGGRAPASVALRSLLSLLGPLERLASGLRSAPEAVEAPPAPAELCRAVVGDWLAQARVLAALDRHFGILSIPVWQPQLVVSGARSPYERALLAGDGAQSPLDAGLAEHRRVCARMIDAARRDDASLAVVNWAGLHATDDARPDETSFLDLYGHTTEASAAREAEDLAALVVERLAARAPAPAPSLAQRAASAPGEAQP